jgi:hypothetical protein
MGIPRPKDLFDLFKFEANLQVTCRRCGRSGVFPTEQVIEYFRHKRWNTSWEMVASRFRCQGFGREGCGAKDAEVSMAPIPKPVVLPKPEPTLQDLKREERRRRG